MLRRTGMVLSVLVGMLASFAEAAAPPGKTRNLTAEEEKEVAALEARFEQHASAGEFEQATKVAQQIADYRQRRQGVRHWRAIDARFAVDEWQRLGSAPVKDRADLVRARALNGEGMALWRLGRFREAEQLLRQALLIRVKVLGKQHPSTATSYSNMASCLHEQGKTAVALPLYQKALEIREKALGKAHPNTATGYNNLAYCLQAQGKTAEALPLHRQALLIREKVLGKNHPDTATSYNNVAGCLQDQGKSGEALPQYRQALLIYERVLGKEHPDTATTYNNVAFCLESQGQAAEALPLLRQALLIRVKVLGEQHPDTASSYNNVASCLQIQGKAAKALPLFRLALLIREKWLGKEHPHTAASYNNVAVCLEAQGKAAEALPLYQRALLIREQVLGKEHPDTATSYNNVAGCLDNQGKVSEALPLYRQALEIREKVLGKQHPDTATSYNNLAYSLHKKGKAVEAISLFQKALLTWEQTLDKEHHRIADSYDNLAYCLHAQGKVEKALPLYRKVLLIRETLQGKDHPQTASSYNNVARCLWEQNRVREAVRLWQQSLGGQEATRLHRSQSGFERAQFTRGISVQTALAVGLATLNQPRNAFRHAEASLARGLLDDLTGLTAAEIDRERELRGQMAKLDPVLASFSSRGDLSAEQKERHEQTKQEYARLSRLSSELLVVASTRAVVSPERIQRAIPPDAALLLWIAFMGERWACIVRTEGSPTWLKLSKSADAKLTDQSYQTLTDLASTEKDRTKHLVAFRKEYFDPLRPHLKGVSHLFVVPTGPLAYIPAELLAEGFAVSYIPSGSVLARTVENHRVVAMTSLLAVGDPIFDKAPPASPPASGVFIQTVLPDTVAAKAGLQSGDVLLSVGKKNLESFDDLSSALSSLPANAEVWRDGKRFTVRLAGSPLGAVFDKRSSRAAVRAWRREREVLAQRGTGHKRLPGTRLEVEAISSMVRGSTTLFGSDASEQRLDDLLASGKLKDYRILHFATHGEANTQIPHLSSLILAQDALPDPAEQVKADKHPYDGRLTVSRIRTRWALDADLVVLSACETGLGKEARGDGLLGFAQAFLSIGARSVILSRWKVDDTATSLLMIRLYENLLGKRKGTKAMGRAAALDEAKKWLRTLPRKEAERLATLQTGGVLRGSESTEKTPDKTKKVEYKGDTPFAHPYYWAAWTLIGDPD